jgi:hypothetical protein
MVLEQKVSKVENLGANIYSLCVQPVARYYVEADRSGSIAGWSKLGSADTHQCPDLGLSQRMGKPKIRFEKASEVV